MVSFGYRYLFNCLSVSFKGMVTMFSSDNEEEEEEDDALRLWVHALFIPRSHPPTCPLIFYLFLVNIIVKLIITSGSLHLLFLFLEHSFPDCPCLVISSTKSFLISLKEFPLNYYHITLFSFKMLFYLLKLSYFYLTYLFSIFLARIQVPWG